MDVNHPILTDGWYSLRVFYKLQHIHQIVFRYVGNSTFHITIFSNMSTISTGVKFLSNLIRLRKKHLFRVKLTKSQYKASHLVNFSFYIFVLYFILFIYFFCALIQFFFQDLQSDFVDYVRKRRLRRLELQGRDNTFIVQCKILLRNTPKKSSKIVKG